MKRFRNVDPNRALGFMSACLCLLLLSGCAFYRGRPGVTVSAYRPSNVFRSAPFIPSDIRRVAVLPISAAPEDWQASQGRGPLEPALKSGVGTIKAFGQIGITREQLNTWTGREVWLPGDELPANFFKKLEEASGCNAVLFTRFHPFTPIGPW